MTKTKRLLTFLVYINLKRRTLYSYLGQDSSFKINTNGILFYSVLISISTNYNDFETFKIYLE